MRFPGLASWIERRARRDGDDVALVTHAGVHTYRDLAGGAARVAALLQREGVRPGDRVAFHGVNDPLALTSLFGAARAGVVWVPIHPGRPEDEVREVLDDAGARLLFRASPDTLPDLDIPVVEAEGLNAGGEAPPLREADPDDLAILAYTSGTTSGPKGVMLTQGNLLWNVVQMLAACAFAPTDVALAAAPFTRMGGLGVTVLPTLFAGGSLVVPGDTDGSTVLGTIERARVSVVFANPDLLERLVREPAWDGTDLATVRTGVVGGGPIPPPLLAAYLERGVRLRHGYGLTEAAPVVSLLDDRDAASHAHTVGKPLPFVDVRTTGPDGREVAPGEIGEWWIRGPNVAAGYWRRPEVRDAQGWFPTGDVGRIDDAGYLHFVDRASSAITVGDVVVYPTVIESALYGTPGVADVAVVEAAGVIVAAVAGEALDESDLSARLGAALPDPALPHEVRSVGAIPRNAAGKVRRDALRALVS
ncbi:MAG TPA: AMP-binding protein [Actinomycetota bacterium]